MKIEQMILLKTAEETCHSLKCALVLLETTHMVMEQEDGPKQYTDALFGLWDYLFRLQADLEDAVGAEYEQRRRGD